jgi:uncharacterized protein YodC (DUF2158 family)
MWPISSCKKVRKCCNPHVYWWNRIGFKQSHFVEDLMVTPRCMFLVSLFWRWDVVSLKVYYNCVKFHLIPMSRLRGVALTSPSLHTERISEYKLNYLPFQILDSNHIPMWPISSCKKVRKCCNPHVYWWNRIGFKQSHFVEDLVAAPRRMFLVSLFWRWDAPRLQYYDIQTFGIQVY